MPIQAITGKEYGTALILLRSILSGWKIAYSEL